jgi:hypothetical protein
MLWPVLWTGVSTFRIQAARVALRNEPAARQCTFNFQLSTSRLDFWPWALDRHSPLATRHSSLPNVRHPGLTFPPPQLFSDAALINPKPPLSASLKNNSRPSLAPLNGTFPVGLHQSTIQRSSNPAFDRLAEIDKGLLLHDAALRDIFQKLRPLLEPPLTPPKRISAFQRFSPSAFS